MKQCLDNAAACIQSGNQSNADRAIYLVNQGQSFSSIYETAVQKMIGHLAVGFTGSYEDDVERVRGKLDESDQRYDRDNGESIL